jgi:hypothetical protein
VRVDVDVVVVTEVLVSTTVAIVCTVAVEVLCVIVTLLLDNNFGDLRSFKLTARYRISNNYQGLELDE